MTRFYKDLHRHPELSFQEKRTSAAVAQRLRGQGYKVTTGIGGTGVVGLLRNGPGPTVLVRADMDALPVQEQTGLAYASKVTGTDPDGTTVPVMHACGHDMHVTCLLGAAELLVGARDAWSGTLMLVFQPAEEVGSGAKAMVKDGLFDRVGTPDVVLGQHVVPLPAGTIGYHPGPAFAATDAWKVTLFGHGAHGSRPEAAIDPVVMAAATVMRLQTVVSREIAGNDTAVVTVAALKAALGAHNVYEVPAATGSEDCGEFATAAKAPICYWLFGGTDPKAYAKARKAGRVAQDIPSNHQSTFAPVIEPTLTTGIQALTAAALAWIPTPATASSTRRNGQRRSG